MAKRAKPAPAFEPHVRRDPASIIGGKFGRLAVLAPTFCGVRVVERVLNIESQLGVRERVISTWQLPNYRAEEISLQSVLTDLKEDMLLHGASHEAVQLVGAVAPFSEEELNIMAKKLETKTTAKKPAAKADKAASTKGAPKAPKAAKEPKGPDTRKISVLKKEHGARAGTTRANMLDTIYKAKTVQDAINAGVGVGDVSWASRAGYISLS